MTHVGSKSSSLENEITRPHKNYGDPLSAASSLHLLAAPRFVQTEITNAAMTASRLRERTLRRSLFNVAVS